MAFERKHKIGIDEVNKNFEITNRSLIVDFLNTSSFHSDSINYGIMDIFRTYLTWFIIDWKVKVIKRPKYGDEVTIKTWGRNVYKCFSYRDFELYVNDELCAVATSKWVLFNIKNKGYENISEDILEKYNNDDSKCVFEEKELEHMKPLDNYEDKKKIVIRNSDLDFNNHVNNVTYFDYLLDYSDGKDYDEFRITYRKEILSDDEVYLCHSKIEDTDYYSIIDSDNNVKTIMECK